MVSEEETIKTLKGLFILDIRPLFLFSKHKRQSLYTRKKKIGVVFYQFQILSFTWSVLNKSQNRKVRSLLLLFDFTCEYM